MRGTLSVFTVLVLGVLGGVSGANATDMNAQYLQGRWALGITEQACTQPDVEYFVFRDNGTFETGRAVKAEAVGFWQLDGHVIHLHLVTSPGFFHDMNASLKEMTDQFSAPFKFQLTVSPKPLAVVG